MFKKLVILNGKTPRDMLKNYCKIAFRIFSRQKGYVLVNITNLTIGLISSLLISIWVFDQLSYDQFHDDKDQLYQVMVNTNLGEGNDLKTDANLPQPLAEVLENDFPEIEETLVVSSNREVIIFDGEDSFKESAIYASNNFFSVFSFSLMSGNANLVLNSLNSCVISQRLAAKYFGINWHEREIVGKNLLINNENFTISGIFQDIPKNSSLQFDLVVPIEKLVTGFSMRQLWGKFYFKLYARTVGNANIEEINAKIVNTIHKYHEGLREYKNISMEIFLYPFTKRYLHNHFKNGKASGGRIVYVQIFSFVALFMMVMAWVNFISLAIARSTLRANEIGIRKVNGAKRIELIIQFCGESFFITLVSMITALLLIAVLLPYFNEWMNMNLSIDYTNSFYIFATIGTLLLVGLFSGVYPAFVLSSFKTTEVFKSTYRSSKKGFSFRGGLVTFQFFLSALMIYGTLAIHGQLNYIMEKNLGLEKNNILFARLGKIKNYSQYATLKHELLNAPGIANATFVNHNPIQVDNHTSDPNWEGMGQDARLSFGIISTGYNFLETMEIALVEGRNFSYDFTNDTVNFLVNETAIKAMDLKDPIGKYLEFWNQKGQIIGVVKDFHSGPLHEPIKPLIIRYYLGEAQYVFVKTKMGETKNAILSMQQVFNRRHPNEPFEYHFLDQAYEKMYQSEMLTAKFANVFASLAILMACIGFFGLASFMVSQKTKEIGIRKIFGASAHRLLILLSGHYLKLIMVALIISVPVANYLITSWLQNFAFRTNLTWWFYIVPAVMLIMLLILAIFGRFIKTVNTNPVEALREK